jgi:ubiquinone/menaquinone biosynthesis C-methylase UbiE
MTAADSFNSVFAAVPRSPTLRGIWRSVYGSDYPEEANPFSFVTLTDLRRIAHELRVAAGETFADLACGRGGPGLWVARETGASLIGIDFSQVGIQQALQQAAELGLSERSVFLVRDVESTRLPDADLDGAMSVDAFWLFPDKPAAAAEIARILRSESRFVFTSWEFEMTPPGWAPQVRTHHQLLRDAGFVVEGYEETPDWERRQRAVYQGILAAQATLIRELGEVAGTGIVQEAREVPALLEQARRVLVVARRT